MSQFTPQSALPKLEDVRIAIAVAEWNGHITSALRDGAVSLLKSNGLKDEDIAVVSVPGAVELTFAASKLIETGNFDAVIIIGCVIKGDTPHFDYVCQSVTQGMTSLNADCDIPVIFGVLTVNEEQQALDRAGGALGNKGTEAAETALKMVALNRAVDELLKKPSVFLLLDYKLLIHSLHGATDAIRVAASAAGADRPCHCGRSQTVDNRPRSAKHRCGA